MMAIMDRLTDKPEWHKKISDEAIVEKWKAEAMAVPDEEWMRIAAAPNSSWAHEAGSRARREATTVKGIMSEGAFDYVSSGR